MSTGLTMKFIRQIDRGHSKFEFVVTRTEFVLCSHNGSDLGISCRRECSWHEGNKDVNHIKTSGEVNNRAGKAVPFSCQLRLWEQGHGFPVAGMTANTPLCPYDVDASKSPCPS